MFSRSNLFFGLLLGVPIGYISCSYALQNIDINNNNISSITSSESEGAQLKSQLALMARYNRWAYQQIHKWCKENVGDDTDKYKQNTGIPFKTISNTLCHLWMADQIWYNRMFGLNETNYKTYNNKTGKITNSELFTFWTTGHENEGKFDEFFDSMNIDETFDLLKQSSNKWIDIVDTFENDKQAFDEFSYKHRSGIVYTQRRSSVIAHVINHATHHRGQISGAATIVCPDATPIRLDLVYYERLMDAK